MPDFAIIKPATIDDSGGFTRASIGWRVNKSGVLEFVGADVPRWNYDPTTLEPAGLLVEPSGTNLITHSQEFDNAAWEKARIDVTANAATSPDGTATADTITVNNTADPHVRLAFATTAGIIHSVFAKKRNTTQLQLRPIVFATATLDLTAIFNFDTVVFDGVSSAIAAHGAIEYPNGWFRIWAYVPAQPGQTSSETRMAPMTAAAFAVGHAADVWGAMAEEWTGADLPTGPSSYIFTSGGPGARAADVVTAKMLSSIGEPHTGTDADPAAWSAATSYPTGSQVTRTTTHKVYERIGAGGVDATLPETDAALATPTKWVEVRSTNRWRMLDAATESQSSDADEIMLCLQPGTVADSLALLNVAGTSARVFVTDSDYDQTQSLYERTATDWLSWLYDEWDTKADLVFTDLPLRSSNLVHIIIRNPGSTAKVGLCVLGRSKSIGGVHFGATAGITDYSTKETNPTTGETELVEGAYSKRMNVSLRIPASKVDQVQRLFATYRATPVVYVGSGNLYGALIVYGFYRSFEIVIEFATYSLCNAEIEGLT